MGYTYQSQVAASPATTSTKSNFTVCVKIVDSKIATVANGGAVKNLTTRVYGTYTQTVPADLVLSTDTGAVVLYNWGYDFYDPMGTAILWVKVPTFATTTSPPIYASVGNGTVTTFQGGAIGSEFDSRLSRVWHFSDGATLCLSDSTSNIAALTNTNGATAIAGKIDGGVNLTASSSQELQTSTNFGSVAMAYSVWVKPISFPNAYNTIATSHGAAGAFFFDLYARSDGKLALYVSTVSGNVDYDGNGVTTLVAGNTYHISMVYDSINGLRGYVNGMLDGSAVANGTLTATLGNTFEVGNSTPFTPRYFDGWIDELECFNSALATDFVVDLYTNQNSPWLTGAFTPISAGSSPLLPMIGCQ